MNDADLLNLVADERKRAIGFDNASELIEQRELALNYAKGEIASWRDLMGAAVTARSVFGVSPSAYQDACEVLGQERAAIVIACILQRAEHINSAGGYLRVLTDRAKAGEFSIWPMLLAQLRANGVHVRLVGGEGRGE